MPAAPGPENPAADSLADDPALWELLDRAPRPPAPGPWFAHRVLRAVACFEAERAVPAWRRRWDAMVATRPRVSWGIWSGATFAGAAGAVTVLAVGTFTRWSSPGATTHQAAPAVVATAAAGNPGEEPAGVPEGAVREGDVSVIADLDELTETNENRVWLDEDDESAS